MSGAVIYARISDDRTGRAAGVARQQADCTALCQSRGWPVVATYVENSTSAYSGKRRPEYQQLRDRIKAGSCTHVVAWHPDRLHRSPRELEDFIDLIEKRGVHIETVRAGRWDLSTPSGRLNARLLGAVARYESEHKSERITRALQENAEQGRPTGGFRAYGYAADKLHLVPGEATVIRRSAARLLAGDSLRGICNDLNLSGQRTVTGTPWTPTTLRGVLRNPRNAALRVHQGQIIGPATWDPILDEDTLHAVGAVLSDPARRTAMSTARVHLLTGIAVCAVCNRGVHPHQGGSGKQNYACRHYGCGKVTIRRASIEAAVIEALHDRLEQTGIRPSPDTPDDGLAHRIAAVEAQLESADRAMEADETMTFDRLSSITRGLTRRLTELRAEQARRSQTSVLQSWAGDSRSRWKAASLERRRALVVAVFDRIAIRPASTPPRLDLTYR